MDLHDLHHNTAGGLHMASLAGAWTALVAGFGGLRDHAGELAFAPSLPEGLDRLAFRLVRGDRVLSVEIHPSVAVYPLVQGDSPMTILHRGEQETGRAPGRERVGQCGEDWGG